MRAWLDSDVVDPLNVRHEQPVPGKRSGEHASVGILSCCLLALINGSFVIGGESFAAGMP